MKNRTTTALAFAVLGSLTWGGVGAARGQQPERALASDPMVDLATIDPTIIVELRYASGRNVTGRPIYPPNTVCLLRRAVAERLKYAQHLLRKKGYGLKVWDGFRPAEAQRILWEFVRNPDYVADPSKGGSLHTWGVAVDATLVDSRGREQKMPTDFDDFTPAASMYYAGRDSKVAKNLKILQSVMAAAGFFGMRDEWWHFVARDSRDYAPDDGASPQLRAAHVFLRR